MSVKKIDELIDKSKSLMAHNITFDDLGPSSNFYEAEKVKNDIFEFVISILGSAKEFIGDKKHAFLPRHLKFINSNIQKVENTLENIKKLASQGIHNQEFPSKRSNLIQQLHQIDSELKGEMHFFLIEIEIFKIKNSIPNDSGVKGVIMEVEAVKDKIIDSASEINKILENVRSRSVEKAIVESTSGFSRLKKSHGKWEVFWFIVLIASLCFVSMALYKALTMEIDVNALNMAFLIKFIKNVLLVSIPAIFLKISINKYSLERNLKIIYTNRETVLDQFKNFENAIGDNAEAKNQFRLEIAKYIFSDPNTGYIGKDSKPGEISINPVINLTGKS